MDVVAVIPARMGSTKYPGKPLCVIQGKTLIQHVYDNVSSCDLVDETYVATPDPEIHEEVEKFSGEAVMTGTYNRPVGRVAEASTSINADKIVIVHGDEPLVTPEMIRKSIESLKENLDARCVNLTSKIEDEEEFEDKNKIKVVSDQENNALYYSRNPVPSYSNFDEVEAYKHIGVITCTKDFLKKYKELEETPLSRTENIDILRVLEQGLNIKIVETDEKTFSVETPEDHEKISNLI